MKIAVKKIGEETLEATEHVAASRWDMDSEDIHFLGDIDIKCGFVRNGNIIEVSVDLNFRRNIRCSRCLEWNTVESHNHFILTYKDGDLKKEFLDIDSDIREQILLEWPLKPLCRPDCRGICPGCGRNLNIEKCICNSSEPKTN